MASGESPTSSSGVVLAPAWGRLTTTWAVLGVALSLTMATWRVGQRALTLRPRELTPLQWAVFAVCTLTFAYGEGYRALHRRFTPAVIARAATLANGARARSVFALLGPLYALGLFYPDRKVCLRAWLSTTAIVLAVFIVRALPDPWRAIIDASVALALAIGVSSLLGRFSLWARS